MKFNEGDMANVLSANGKEILVRVIGDNDHGAYPVQELDANGNLIGASWIEKEQELLQLKQPGFRERGVVFTTSATHRGEQGEIVALGEGPNKQAFYRVKFADGHMEWFSERDVFIEVKDNSMETWEALGQ